ncbi:MAG TPA: hypothetical protein VF331_14615 [Polyangiales bacterium]
MRSGSMLRLAALSLLLTAAASQVHAQFAARLLVVRGPDVPASIRADASSALSNAGELVDSGEYVQAAREQGLPPSSEDALQTLGPAQYATMIVVLEGVPGERKLHLTYREGRGATPVLQQDVDYRGKHLTGEALTQIEQAAQQALEQVRGSSKPKAPSRFGSGRFGPSRVAPAPAAPAEPAPAVEEAPPAAFGEPSPAAAPPAAEPVPETAPAETSESEPLDAALDVGFGIGMRSAALPTSAGDRELSSGVFPTLALAVHAQAAVSDHVLFGARIRYDSSLGLFGHETPANGAPKETGLRVTHVEFGVTPGLRFTKSKDAVVLGLFAGWGIRGMRTVVDLSIPSYMLEGPLVRVELRIPIADGKVVLRLAPELQGIVYVSGAFQNAGDVASGGLALGVEAALRVAVSEPVAIEATFRESHASVATAWSASFSDIERFATVAAVVQY